MDRNYRSVAPVASPAVALRKESVDRNMVFADKFIKNRSLSARRAWIEIDNRNPQCRNHQVALRKESVDRNTEHNAQLLGLGVALRKESVDRNLGRLFQGPPGLRRSPQGERG